MKVYPLEEEKCQNCGASLEENCFNDKNEFGETIGRCASCGYIVWS